MNQRMLEVLSGLLELEEREAVLGDLAESDKSSYTSMRDLAGLVIRRQPAAWKRPRRVARAIRTRDPVSVLININSGHTTDNFAFQTWKYFAESGGLSSLFCNARS